MANNTNYTQKYPKNAMDNPKLQLTGIASPEMREKNQYPKAMLRSVGNNVKFACYPNSADSDEGKYFAIDLDLNLTNTVLCLVDDAVAEQGDFPAVGVVVKNYTFNNGQRSDKPMDQGTIMVGKNGEGEVQIILSPVGHSPVVFPFTCGYFNALVDKGGVALDKAAASRLMARGWVKTVRDCLAVLSVVNYKAPEPKQGGFNAGTDNSNSGSYSNNNSSNSNVNTGNGGDDVFSAMM